MVPVTLPRPRALVFDVMGTVGDLDGAIPATTDRVLAARRAAEDVVDAVVRGTAERLGASMRAVSDGERPWAGHRELHRAALREAVAALDLAPLSAEEEDDLSRVVGWADP